MKKIFLISALFLVFSCSENVEDIALQYEAQPSEIKVLQEFVQGSQDIPLAENLEKIIDDSIDFDSNSGSIISSSYKSKITKNEVKIFYIKTLPDLGWLLEKNLENKIVFKREKTQLEIEFNSKNIVTFFISSAL